MRPLVPLFLFMKLNSVSGFKACSKLKVVLLLAILASVLAPRADLGAAVIHSSARERSSFNSDWRFIKGDPEGVGTSLSYTNIKPWVTMTGSKYSTIAPSARPEGDPPGENVLFAQPGFDDK